MEQNWNTVKSCIITSAENLIGRGTKKQPDWFSESSDILVPLINIKNSTYDRLLQRKQLQIRNVFVFASEMLKGCR